MGSVDQDQMLEHARLVIAVDSNGAQTAFSPEYVALCRAVLQSQWPEYMATILLRALTWCGDQITQDEREAAWAWVEKQRGNIEEMGG